jgi:hypothetical protein
MNPAEEIVKFALQEKGYFLQSSIRLPKNKEIDILAKKGNENLHIEVSVSVRCANYDKNAKRFAKEVSDKKFESVKNDVEQRLGTNYKKLLVVGKISLGKRDILPEFVQECKRREIEVITIQQILDEIRPVLSTHTYLNSVIKTVQIAQVFK